MRTIEIQQKTTGYEHLPVFYAPGDDSYPITDSMDGDETGKNEAIAFVSDETNRAITMQDLLNSIGECTHLELEVSLYKPIGNHAEYEHSAIVKNVIIHAENGWIELVA